MLKKLGVSTSGYYDWKNRKPSARQQKKETYKKEIQEIYDSNYAIYGAPKITRILRSRGHKISERTVTRYMKEMGLKAVYVRPYTVTTISKDFTSKLKNTLSRQFSPEKPNAVWVTDITYIPTDEGFLYLSCVMDLYSRRILAWELGKTLETKYVIAVINKAIKVTGCRPKVIHTDRGVQYTSDAYYEATENIEKSYSRPGNPWDNACIESFHALLKREWLNRFRIKNYEDAHTLIFEYIDAFYNTVRIHSHCGYTSPYLYERLYQTNNRGRLIA